MASDKYYSALTKIKNRIGSKAPQDGERPRPHYLGTIVDLKSSDKMKSTTEK